MPYNLRLSSFLCVLLSVILIFSVWGSGNAERAQNCDAPYEMLTTLYHPEPGVLSVWDSLHGEPQKSEGFASVIEDGEGVIAIGDMQALAGVTPSLMIVKFDRRGRVLWERYHSIAGFRNVVKAHPHKDGFAVLINQYRTGKKASLWYGVFDKTGQLLKQKIISDKFFNIHANDFIPKIAGDGWVIPLTASYVEGAGILKNEHKKASIYIVDNNGDEISSRSYVLGKSSEILSLSVSKKRGSPPRYVATGYYENDYNKDIAWMMLLSEDASLVYQKEFSRGESAKLTVSAMDKKGHIYIAGNVKSVKNGQQGTWLAKLNQADGRMMWQRYNVGELPHYDYSAEDMYVNDDGLIVYMLGARLNVERYEAPEAILEIAEQENVPENIDFSQLLILSPRGTTLDGNAFYYGLGASIQQMIEGKRGNPIMAGYSIVSLSDLEKDVFNRKKREVEVPLIEGRHIDLPDAPLTDNTKKGLAMLKKKIKAQGAKELNNKESKNTQSAYSAKMEGVTRDGWVVIGDTPGEYDDPCE